MVSLLARYEAFAIDLDGVVWRGGRLVEGAAEGIGEVRRAGKPLLLLTNNATYSPRLVADRLRAAGIVVDESEVLNSAMVLREWIKEKGFSGAEAFVMGEQSVSDQLHDLVKAVPVEEGRAPDLVVVARDVGIDFARLAAAADAVRYGAGFVAVNRDNVLPTQRGFEPGTGAVLAAIEVASGRTAVVVGKPEMPMMEAAARRLGKAGVLMLGDRLDSDVEGARRIGWDAAIVLTGVTQLDQDLIPPPDFVLDTLTAIGRDVDQFSSS